MSYYDYQYNFTNGPTGIGKDDNKASDYNSAEFYNRYKSDEITPDKYVVGVVSCAGLLELRFKLASLLRARKTNVIFSRPLPYRKASELYDKILLLTSGGSPRELRKRIEEVKEIIKNE